MNEETLQSTVSNETISTVRKPTYRYILTGKAAHSRIGPLLPQEWIDGTKTASETYDEPIDFLWENSPRFNTKRLRNGVKCYSHLPNGSILDDKWALARVTSRKRHFLESYCFRGMSGFRDFACAIGLWDGEEIPVGTTIGLSSSYPKLLDATGYNVAQYHCVSENLSFPCANVSAMNEDDDNAYTQTWVIKDANCNGAGGIWIVSKRNIAEFLRRKQSDEILFEDHRYVAQKYAFPPLLWKGRKSHVRCYCVLTADGKCYVHRKAFLHVANSSFTDFTSSCTSDQCVHITNCCANSHDEEKFAGEICIDFEDDWSSDDAEILSSFFPSIKRSIREVVKSFRPFVENGLSNNGFEYLGLDFILSGDYDENNQHLLNLEAYLLEINSPPSQDTATGLPHAEDVHNSVLSDLIKLWIEPNVCSNMSASTPGGWRLVSSLNNKNTAKSMVSYDRCVLMNRFRWAAFETRMLKLSTHDLLDTILTKRIQRKARSQFEYFSLTEEVFFENAGGSQVPNQCTSLMMSSLQNRDRSTIGNDSKLKARTNMKDLLNAPSSSSIFFGSNATSLLRNLALAFSGFASRPRFKISAYDEIVVSDRNHSANIDPWVTLSQLTGAKLVWWESENDQLSIFDGLKKCISSKTKIVAISHSSNVLGYVYDIEKIVQVIKQLSNGKAQVVVDGVGLVPHRCPNLILSNPDWYVISTHKMFGPHGGVLCGSEEALGYLYGEEDTISSADIFLENGTVNIEACEGMSGVYDYFSYLGSFPLDVCLNVGREQQICHSPDIGKYLIEAYRRIQISENYLMNILIGSLRENPNVCIIEEKFIDENNQDGALSARRLPIVSFIHRNLSSMEIVRFCRANHIKLRNGYFLSEKLLRSRGVDIDDGVVRISLSHYNTVSEINRCIRILKKMDNW